MMPNRTDEFRRVIQGKLEKAAAEEGNRTSITITAKELRDACLDGKKKNEWPMISQALMDYRTDGDSTEDEAPKGKGSKLKVTFKLPRPPDGQPKAHQTAATETTGEDPESETEFPEGERMLREMDYFLRSTALVKKAKAKRGTVCEVCKFDFEARYGTLGKGFIECHHIKPISGRGGQNTPTKIDDLRVLCANCHRMIHRQPGGMTLEELESLLCPPAVNALC